MKRRDVLRAIAGLPLVACDSREPNRGGLGRMERWNERFERALQGDRASTADERTPPEAFPKYHIAPGVPQAPSDWKLVVGGRVTTPLSLSLADLRAMPRIEARIEHHCVEGWSAVADWAGVPLVEIARACGELDNPYVEFQSFDAPEPGARGYWSSWDRESAFHPQTMLAYEMNGAPLTPEHGAPLRLYGSIKLGYKMVKYLDGISFLDRRTGGYWEDQGYEWFAGT